SERSAGVSSSRGRALQPAGGQECPPSFLAADGSESRRLARALAFRADFRHMGCLGGDFHAMTATNSLLSDAELLARYLREDCEASFAAIVAQHQSMVVGTALRRTGDLELARDVAQQVFALLARKAAWLTERDSLAGWLYRSAFYLGT